MLLVSHRFWQERLGLDPKVIGGRLTLDGGAYTVIGTLQRVAGSDRNTADVWMPLALTRGQHESGVPFSDGVRAIAPGRDAGGRAGGTGCDRGADRSAIIRRRIKESGVIVDPLADRVVGREGLRQIAIRVVHSGGGGAVDRLREPGKPAAGAVGEPRT